MVDGFRLPFEVKTNAIPCVRKVKTTRKITLLPGQKAYSAERCG